MNFDLTNWLRRQSACDKLPVIAHNLQGMAASDTREWLVTNGLGSYASGALNTANSRRYHGLLVASLTPPVRRTVLLSHLDETLTVAGASPVQLATNYWQSGLVAPEGYKSLESFSDLPCPTWCFRIAGGRLIKQIFMLAGEQRVYAGYTWLPDDDKSAADLDLEVLLNYRDFHNQTKGADDWRFGQELKGEKEVTIRPYDIAQPFTLQLDHGKYTPAGQNDSGAADWYKNYYWPREHERGLAESEDCFHAGRVSVKLSAGQSVTFVAGLEPLGEVRPLSELIARATSSRLKLLTDAGALASPAAVQRLVLASDQFLAHRQSTDGSTIIAGYHWFSDWGRDSMISLPGLCLSTARPDVARSILATFGKYLSEGMLPNFFPDGGQAPEYNTSDATLWWAQALYNYYEKTGDKAFVVAQLPLLQEVVDWHIKGTRHGLRLDADGLITGGDKSVQLTWMDAKCGDFVVTPRSGKAVEISALWYNFLRTIEYLQKATGTSSTTSGATSHSTSGASAQVTASGFAKFWDEKRGYLADVIREDGSIDDSLRPNQLLAAALTFPIVTQAQAAAIVTAVEAKLLTPMGLRTLSPDHPDYKGLYGLGLESANQYSRDVTYHQGTVWPWLLGPWVNARLYAYGPTEENYSFIREHLKPILAHIEAEGCLGSVSEIFDGDAPHKPQGCVAQAWSVAELLRVLTAHPQLCS
jgi:predicted glycogen debranching enzyme